MTEHDGTRVPVLVGRTLEQRTVGLFLDQAAAGTAGSLLVSGEAGVGKTALLQHACSRPGTLVLTGSCLPLTSMTVPFMALRSAVRVLPRSPGPGAVPRPAFLQTAGPPAHIPTAFDAWLEELCGERPVILVIEDLQWADRSTLDVLMYLMAGPADRRLAVLATLRNGEPGGDHPLRNWLADLGRLPRIERLTLGPLDRTETEEQLTGLFGASPHQSLVDEVFAHTGGNAYLNRLVVAGLPPRTRHLPADLPADLKAAVRRSWHRLSPRSRELLQIIAVGGGPVGARALATLIGGAPEAGKIPARLREAASAGIVDPDTAGRYWFHHPLTAEVLAQDLPAEERRHWHGVFAEHYQRQSAHSALPDVDAMVAAADHHHHAGHTAQAYRWALLASEAAGSVGGDAEMLRLLSRAAVLRRRLPGSVDSERSMLEKLRDAAAGAGAHEVELEAVEALLAGTDPDGEPLRTAELMVRRMHLRFSTGREFLSVQDMREAVRLSAADPGSWQHALALAELAHAGVWQDDPGVTAHAERALAVARAAGNPRALSYALTANTIASSLSGRPVQGRAFAAEAITAARGARDYWAFFHAAFWEANITSMWQSPEHAALLGSRRRELEAAGAPHPYCATLAAAEAGSWLAVGRWHECRQALRVALGSDPGPLADVSSRLTAARLAGWQGRQSEAEAHLARADELFAQHSEFLNHEFDAVRAEIALAAGNPEAAYDAALTGITQAGVPPTMCEWLLPLAARALADLIQQDRDTGQDPGTRLARLADLSERFPTVLREAGWSPGLYEVQLNAFTLLYAAELGRARQDPGNIAVWEQAADTCRSGMLAWEEAYACWRGTEALLLHGYAQRERAAALLRRGRALADGLQAEPIRERLTEMAVRARIPVTAGGVPEPARDTLPGLTRREREILDYVIAGRTYGEIARALVISEKTVSTHISHLLRKTGASNRLDLARLATRNPGTSAR